MVRLTPEEKKKREEAQKFIDDNSVALPISSVEQAEDDIESMEEMFSGEGATESSILKELFTVKNFKTKSQLTADEISIISRLYFMATVTKRPYLKNILDEYVTLQISRDRQSRKEFVEAHKDRQVAQKQGLFGSLLGGNGGTG